jgi:hypothetical protein
MRALRGRLSKRHPRTGAMTRAPQGQTKPAAGAVAAPASPVPTIVRVRRGRPSDLRWQALADQFSYDELTNLRARAEKWAAGSVAVIGTFGLASLFKGRESVAELAFPGGVVAGVLFLIAIVAGAVSTYLGTRAAQGEPEEFWLTGPTLWAKTRVWARKAKQDLDNARKAALIALIALVAMAAAVVYWPKAPATATQTQVVRTDGTLVCGELKAGPDGTFLVTTISGDVSVAPGSVLAVHSVAGC